MAASLAQPFALDDEAEATSVLASREGVAKTSSHWARRSDPPLVIRAEVQTRWLASVARDLSRLLALPENWDSYGGHAVRQDAAAGVIKLLAKLGADVAAPLVAPMSNGGILLEWNSPAGDLEIEIEREDRVNFLAEDTQTEAITEEEGVTQSHFLAEFRSKLSHLIPSA